jgi:hypothetical protein
LHWKSGISKRDILSSSHQAHLNIETIIEAAIRIGSTHQARGFAFFNGFFSDIAEKDEPTLSFLKIE